MDAKRPALTNQAVEPQCGFLCQLVLLDEELLELVHDQEDPWERGRTGCVPIAVDVLHAGIAEPVGAQAELGIQALQDAEPELALALDRHDAGVRQLVGRIDLELDAFLEVDQVQVDLVGAVVQGDVDDERVHQSRFAGAGTAGNQDVLGGAVAQLEMLSLGRPRLAERHVDLAPAVLCPPGVVGRSDELEGDLDALGVLRRGADALDLPRREVGGGRRVEHQGVSSEIAFVPDQARPVPRQAFTVRLEVAHREVRRERLGLVDGDQDEDAAGNAPGGDRRQASGRLLVEAGGEVGDDQHAVRLGDLAGHGVVLLERGVLVPEILLGHHLHVGRQVGQTLVNLAGVGPDLVGHQGPIVVGEVHEGPEIPADADRIDDREADLAGWQARQHAEHRCLEDLQSLLPAFGRGDDEQVGRGRECAKCRQVKPRWQVLHQAGVGRKPARQLGHVERDLAHAEHRREHLGE